MACVFTAFHNANMSTTIGDAIRHFRQHAGLKQEALAARIGTDANTISRLERGQVQPTLMRLQALAEALERPCSDFFLHVEQAAGTRETLSSYSADHLVAAIRCLDSRQREALGAWLEAFGPGRDGQG